MSDSFARPTSFVLFAIALSLAPCGASLRAQEGPAHAELRTVRRWPSVWLSGGAIGPNDGAGKTPLPTATGGVMLAAIEVPRTQQVGPFAFTLRGEVRWSHQPLATTPNSGLSGDVQTLGGALTLRVSTRNGRVNALRGVAPYALLGIGMIRPSTRVAVTIIDPDLPSARFSQTSSARAATAQGGLGALIDVHVAHLFVEVRSDVSRREAATTRSLFGTVGVSLQSRR